MKKYPVDKLVRAEEGHVSVYYDEGSKYVETPAIIWFDENDSPVVVEPYDDFLEGSTFDIDTSELGPHQRFYFAPEDDFVIHQVYDDQFMTDMDELEKEMLPVDKRVKFSKEGLVTIEQEDAEPLKTDAVIWYDRHGETVIAEPYAKFISPDGAESRHYYNRASDFYVEDVYDHRDLFRDMDAALAEEERIENSDFSMDMAMLYKTDDITLTEQEAQDPNEGFFHSYVPLRDHATLMLNPDIYGEKAQDKSEQEVYDIIDAFDDVMNDISAGNKGQDDVSDMIVTNDVPDEWLQDNPEEEKALHEAWAKVLEEEEEEDEDIFDL